MYIKHINNYSRLKLCLYIRVHIFFVQTLFSVVYKSVFILLVHKKYKFVRFIMYTCIVPYCTNRPIKYFMTKLSICTNVQNVYMHTRVYILVYVCTHTCICMYTYPLGYKCTIAHLMAFQLFFLSQLSNCTQLVIRT